MMSIQLKINCTGKEFKEIAILSALATTLEEKGVAILKEIVADMGYDSSTIVVIETIELSIEDNGSQLIIKFTDKEDELITFFVFIDEDGKVVGDY